MAEIDQIYKEKIQEPEEKGPLYFAAHEAGNDVEAARTNNLQSLSRYMSIGEVIDTQKLFSYANLTTVPHEKGGLVAILCDIMGIDEDTCRRSVGPHNAKSNKLPSLAKYMKNGQVTHVPDFIWLRNPYSPDESAECFIV